MSPTILGRNLGLSAAAQVIGQAREHVNQKCAPAGRHLIAVSIISYRFHS